jgi:hypothetical protein
MYQYKYMCIYMHANKHIYTAVVLNIYIYMIYTEHKFKTVYIFMYIYIYEHI